jgi:hypothetical protein
MVTGVEAHAAPGLSGVEPGVRSEERKSSVRTALRVD